MKERTSEIGELLGPSYHDGIVVGILAVDATFSLQIEKADGLVELTISGVLAYGLAPLCKGAILSNIRAIPQVDWDDVTFGDESPWSTLVGKQITGPNLAYEPARLKAKGNALILFVLDFSYGGEIAVVGLDWSLEKLGPINRTAA